jgi:hypothetical protein
MPTSVRLDNDLLVEDEAGDTSRLSISQTKKKKRKKKMEKPI